MTTGKFLTNFMTSLIIIQSSTKRGRSSAGKSHESREHQKERKDKDQERKREQERKKQEHQKQEKEKDQERQREHEFRSRDKEERKQEKHMHDDSAHMQASFGDSPGEMEKFDLEFDQEMEKFDQKLCQLGVRAKTLATMWKAKLRVKPHSVEEARSRNIIANYLTKCSGEGVFEMEPFNHIPPPLDLVTLRNKMVGRPLIPDS